MREIKFRAIHKLTKKMWNEEELVFHNGKWYEDWRSFEDGMSLNMNQCEVMQYTGLKDKNGVEIYEGDILNTFSNINKYTDSFAEDIEPKFEYTTIVRDGACFKTTYKKRPSYVLNENSGSMVEHTEVIGNIYENPELLEREGK